MAEKIPISSIISKVLEVEDQDIKLSWREAGVKPPDIANRGTSVVHGSVVYLLFQNRVVSYSLVSKDWDIGLPVCRYWSGSVAIVRDLLTVIGGTVGYHTTTMTNKLFTLVSKGKKVKWVQQFPPMPTKRDSTVAISTDNYVIVAGGTGFVGIRNKYTQYDTVEVLDTESLKWYTAASLPHPYCGMSAALFNDNIYLLGGVGDNYHSVFSCSMADLLESCGVLPSKKALAAKDQDKKEMARMPVTWEKLYDMPVQSSTCAVICGQLLAFGGSTRLTPVDRVRNVYKYNPTTDSWVIISHMLTPRCNCFVINSSENEVIVLCGANRSSSIEVATVVPQINEGPISKLTNDYGSN